MLLSRPASSAECLCTWLCSALGIASVNGYLCYVSVCNREKVAKKHRLTHRDFQAELCDQLCHPEKRERVPGRASPRRAPPTPAAPASSAPPPKKAKKSLLTPKDDGKRGSAHVSMLGQDEAAMDARLLAISRGDVKSHCIDEPPDGKKVVCQMCYYKWIKAGRPGSRGPQKVAQILCCDCNHAVCGPTCLNQLHGLKPWTGSRSDRVAHSARGPPDGVF